MSTFPPKPNALETIFGISKPIIGMVHSLALPGSPRFKYQKIKDVYEFGVEEALRLKEGGVDGIILENGWDLPFAKPEQIGLETVGAMSVLAQLIRQATGLPLGINVLANAAKASLATALASGANFIRVNQWVNAYVANEGFVEGKSGDVTRYRAWIGADDVKIFADVHVKHGSHAIVADRPLTEQARDAEFFDADVLIATGQRTGDETPFEEVTGIKEAVSLPVIVGSGLTFQNCRRILSSADGAIVGSSVKDTGTWWGEVSVQKVQELMAVVREIRQESAKHQSPTALSS
jgi:membrane complex biogenesis BtpA family protein